DAADRPVHEDGVEAADVGRTELVIPVLADPVLGRRRNPPAYLVAVPAGGVALVIGRLRLAELVGAHALVAGQQRVRGAVGDHGDRDRRAALVLRVGRVGVVAPDHDAIPTVAEGRPADREIGIGARVAAVIEHGAKAERADVEYHRAPPGGAKVNR